MHCDIKQKIYELYRLTAKLNLYVKFCGNSDINKIEKELNEINTLIHKLKETL